MSIDARLSSSLIVALLCVAVAPAQQPVPLTPPANGDIYLDVVVTPKSGPPVTGLRQQDFTVLDNKVPQTITSFHALGGSQAPVKVILLVDAVNTDYIHVGFERDQIDRFLRANAGRLAYPTTLAVVTDTGTQLMPSFSTDGNALSTSLDQYSVALRNVRRSAGVWGDAEKLQISLKALHQLAEHEATVPGRKLILWVSPGWPLLSGPSTELSSQQEQQIFADAVGFSDQLREARITLYSIDPLGSGQGLMGVNYYKIFLKGLAKPSQASLGSLGLQVLAVQSGGLALSSDNDVGALLQQCIADTQAYYELSFTPSSAEQKDEYHQLKIQLSGPSLIARTRQGYYAQTR